MAGLAFGGPALGGGFSLAAAGYQTSTGFAARHETTHAQQVETTKRYVAEFEDAYKKDEVTEEDWKQFLSIRDKAREDEKVYEDSIEAYKETPIYSFIRKWRRKKQVRAKKKKLRQSNRKLRSHYDSCSSSASDASSISAEHGSPSRATFYSDEDEEKISHWARDVAASDSGFPPGSKPASDSKDQSVGCAPCCVHDLKGHDRWVMSLSFSPDGKRVASGSWDRTIRIWDAQTGKCVTRLDGHKEPVQFVSFSPDGKLLASGSWDQTVIIWDAETGTPTAGGPLIGHSLRITSITFSPDGKSVVTGSADTTIWIWDPQTSTETAGPLTGHTGPITSLAFSPDGKHFVSTSLDETIRVWDAIYGMGELMKLRNPQSRWDAKISAVYSPDGKRVVLASSDGNISTFLLGPGMSRFELTVSRLKLPRLGKNSCIVWSADGRYIALGSKDGYLAIVSMDMEKRAVLKPWKADNDLIVSVAFSPDGRHVASSSLNGMLRIWSVGDRVYSQ